MASKIKADQFETLDGSGNITLNNSVTMASGKTLPAASLTGALPAISGASLTGVTSVGGATGVDFNDDVKIRSGTGNDLEIYHNGTNSIIKNSTGITKIQADDIRIQSADDSESLAKFVKDGAVELYYNDSKKLETTSAGGTLTGTWNVGKILQVVQAVKVDTFSHGSASWADITGLTVNITPSSSSNKILVSYITNLSGSTTGGHTCLLRCLRGSTAIGVGTGASNRKPASGLRYNHNTADSSWFSFEYLDSPSTTSATTYKVQLYPENGNTAYVNRSGQDGDYTYHGRFASFITVKEIEG